MEIKALTGIRGIAAIIVLWFHIKAALASRGVTVEMPSLIERLLFSGGHSVDIFFVLSGFILALTYKNWFKESISFNVYAKYFRRRFARIYPLHFVLLALTAIAVLLAQKLDIKANLGFERFDFATLPEHFFLINAWGIFSDNSGAWNPPSWSISIELLAYLILPVAIFLFARLREGASWLLFAATVLAGFGLNMLTHWGDYGFAGAARGISEFILGCVSARFFGTSVARVLQSAIGSWLSLFALVVVCATVDDTGFIVGLCAAPLILALCGSNAVARFFTWRPIHFLGEISYSVYIGHFLYTLVVWRVISPEWMGKGTIQLLTGFIGVNALVIAASTLTYYLIECPGRDFLSDKKPIATKDK